MSEVAFSLLDACGLRILALSQQSSIFAFRRFCWGMLGGGNHNHDYRDFDVVKQIFNNNPSRFVAYYQRRCRGLLITKYEHHPLLERRIIDKIIYEWVGW